MEGLLDAQRLALGAWQAACARRPAVHAHQLLALQRERALCAAAPDITGYLCASGGGFEACRGAWLDRVSGRLRLALTIGDGWAARAALVEYRGALQATGTADWTGALTAAAVAASPWHRRAAEAQSGLVRTLSDLLLQHTSMPGLADHRADALGAWQAWCRADPAAAAALWQGGPLPLRVALRLPWGARPPPALTRLVRSLPEPSAPKAAVEADASDVQRDLCAAWQRSWQDAQHAVPWPTGSAGSAAAAADRPSTADALASAEQALLPWRQLAQPPAGAAAGARAVADVARTILQQAAGAASGPEVQRRLIESGLSAALAAAPLRVQLDQIDARQRQWPQPVLAAHAAGLRQALADAHTDTEVELLAAHADACLAIEADWQALLYGVALAPLRAALMHSLYGAEAAPAWRQAAALSHGLLGLGPRAALRLPLLQDLVRGPLARTLALAAGLATAWHGEAGHELLPPLRAWREVAASRGRPMATDAQSLPLALDELLAAAGDDGGGAPQPVALTLWSRSEPFERAAGLLAAPVRPAVQAWDDGVVAAGAL